MIEATIALISTSFLLLGSPGPAPIALAATGATYGIRGGVSFLLGILSGLLIAILGAIVGLCALFSAFPNTRVTVQILGGLYICYIAAKIATAPVINSPDSASVHHAQKFVDGFILNLLNPKAYAAFLAIFSQFLLPIDHTILAFITTGSICFLVGAIVDVVWLSFGAIIAPLFRHPRQARILRVSFAILMIAAVVWTFLR